MTMKAPSFWYKPRGWQSYALAPLGRVYRMGGAVRRAVSFPYRARVPVICVGNIVVGGSGKTPTAMALARLLQEQGHKPVFVTRGYGGKKRGPLRVDPERHTASDVGDEALLLARVAPVWIGRNRAAAVRAAEKSGSTHIILDDGLQNTSIRPSVSFLVINGATGFGNGCIIPAGPMREPLRNALPRISAAVVIGEKDEQKVTARIYQPVFRARTRPVFTEDFPRDAKFFAFAGIAHPDRFYGLCRRAGLTLAGTKDFPDHHVFTDAERDALLKEAEAHGARLLTTEKDWVRLPPEFRAKVLTVPLSLTFDYPSAVLRMFER